MFGGVLGTGFGVALGFFLFPYVFPPPESKDTLTDAERTVVLARGAFIDANPSDPIHYGTGGVTVYRRTVFLEPGSKVVIDATRSIDAGELSIPSRDIMERALETWRRAELPDFDIPKRLDFRLDGA